ncbi:uncharacterized protein LOC110111636 isoform X1 [Dendrobium catenatum]|uniref:Protein translocase subunit SecA n=1 Tax=Dendrobium catenatum TaxID=906689 RepID=A0A2I0WH77_9ASPA|nr:uncharacterized protein LOC110111636 isoform X1 [Dendrobium catenatum]PKU75024.1 hypothetical protein MA16_Dca019952 [Dendrobium catenatum]
MHRMGSVRSLSSLLNYTHCQPRFVRSISSTPRLESLGWVDKIKGVFTGKKPSLDSSAPSFSLTDFADQMEKARGMGLLKKFEVGRCSEATMTDAFKKQSSILRYLGNIDPTGENLQPSHKHEATKHCNCTISEVEHILSKYKWAKDAQKKVDKLKEEGKALPKSFSEVQKLMGSTPLDVARSNMPKSSKIGRNDPCSCGSGKKYKRCCGPP